MNGVIGRTILFALLLLIVGLVLLLGFGNPSSIPKAQQPQECPVLLWSDEFDGAELNTSFWEFQLGNGCEMHLCGWGNNELQYYTKQNTIVSNGTLKILALDNKNGNYTSSRIRSIGVASQFEHGRFEARIKLPFGQGIWPAFWMMPTDSVYGIWPKSGEIDIMENIGHEVSTIHGTVHYADSNGGHQYQTQSVNHDGVKLSLDFHEFAIEKSEGIIRWFVDGSEYFTVESTSVSTWPFEEAFHFILNVAIGGDWPGYPDDTTTFPQVMEVDHVRAYSDTASFGRLVGPRIVQRNETRVEYSVLGSTIWSSFDWDVSDTIKLVKITGNSILVDFGDEPSARIQVTAHSEACGISKEFSIGITVRSSVVDLTFVDGADTSLEEATLLSATGTYRTVPNPSVDSTNPSQYVVEYVRNSGVLYDTIMFHTRPMTHLGDYLHGPRRIFSMDLLRFVSGQTTIMLQLENSARANPGNFPIGRHSRYQARLPESASSGVWHRLSFILLDQPDAAETQVDTLVLLFEPGSLGEETYYFDNLESSSVLESN